MVKTYSGRLGWHCALRVRHDEVSMRHMQRLKEEADISCRYKLAYRWQNVALLESCWSWNISVSLSLIMKQPQFGLQKTWVLPEVELSNTDRYKTAYRRNGLSEMQEIGALSTSCWLWSMGRGSGSFSVASSPCLDWAWRASKSSWGEVDDKYIYLPLHPFQVRLVQSSSSSQFLP